MALVLVVGSGIGWVAYRARVERMAAEAILQAGGHLYYDWQWRDGKADSKAQPGWLTRHLGPGYFEHIVSFSGGPKLDDAALVRIGRLEKLEWLILHECLATERGMAHIRGLTGLKKLQFVTERAKGESLANLAGMVHLRSLRLYGISIADADLVHLSRMTGLEDLVLEGPGITDAGLTLLDGFPNLESLWLDDLKVTDAGIIHLSGLKELDTLSLKGTEITDAGLTHLTSLTKLRRLFLNGTNVTPAGIASLQSKLPGLTIIP